MSIWKPIKPNNFQAREFEVNKEHSLTQSDTGSVVVYKGVEETGSQFNPNTAVTTSRSEFQRLIYESVNHLYYQYKHQPFFTFGSSISGSTVKNLNDRFTVASVSQLRYGEKIKPGTIEYQDTDKGITLLDDRNGNLFDESNSASFAETKSEWTVGNVFYEHGNLVVTETGSYDNFGTGSFILTFDGVHRITEYSITCEVEPGEFNYTMNASAISGSGGKRSGSYYIELFASQSDEYGPYITTVGLYNDDSDLIATGKLKQPIMNQPHLSFVIVVRWDT